MDADHTEMDAVIRVYEVERLRQEDQRPYDFNLSEEENKARDEKISKAAMEIENLQKNNEGTPAKTRARGAFSYGLRVRLPGPFILPS